MKLEVIDFLKKATEHSATCFLNSFLKEWTYHQVLDTQVRLPLNATTELVFPLRWRSLLGRHQYTGQFLRVPTEGQAIEISFGEVVESVTELVSQSYPSQPDQVTQFQKRVLKSLDHIHKSIERRVQEIQKVGSLPVSFCEGEQGLWIGHNFHPTPKSRDEFDFEDLLNYSPEFGGKFHLEWFMARSSVVFQRKAESFQDSAWTKTLLLQEFPKMEEWIRGFGSEFVPFPAHPWQIRRLAKDPFVAELIRKGDLVYLGEAPSYWHPTSSVRSIYRENAPYMLKFSMTVKLTNSIRTLYPHEVERGLQLFDVLNTAPGKQFLSENPQFEILGEPAYLGLRGEDGKPILESLVVCRENRFFEDKKWNRVLLATLTQDPVLGGRNWIQQLILNQDSEATLMERSKQWFRDYMNAALTPLFSAQGNYGIFLGAHQQNLILNLQGGFPVGAVFRDCQGTGYSELGYSNFAHLVKSITRDNGNVVSEKMGNTLFSYYLILNSTLNVISAIASSGWISEEELLEELRSYLQMQRAQGVLDSSCLDYLLESQQWGHKGNFLCAFRGINENTTPDPVSVYTSIESPFIRRQEALSPTPPVRPVKRQGSYYKRYCPTLRKTLSFRTVDLERDLDTFHGWHHQERVSQFWDLNRPRDELRAYLERGLSDPHQIPMIFEVEGEPTGYFEMYWAMEDRLGPYYDAHPYDRGFHFLIGNPEFKGVAQAGAAIQSAMHFLFVDEPRTERLVAEPRSDNKKALKYIEIIPSWKFIKEFDFPHKRAALLMSQRLDFFNHFYQGFR